MRVEVNVAEPNARPKPYSGLRNAPNGDKAKQFFTVTHPFHPKKGQRFELIDCQRRWGQWRVYHLTEDGQQAFLPASWTDVGPRDPFVEQAEGRAIARIEDLLELTKMAAGDVNENKPQL
jgi:hypothetical protein